ncbi:MAG: AMP-binding protein [Bdellovibrionota bacterium]
MESSHLPINWESRENIYLLNSRIPVAEKVEIENKIKKYFSLHPDEGLIALQTSGTTGAGKTVVHSRQNFLSAAAAVNNYLKVSKEDKWLRALPLFHVGGLSIEARAYLSGSKVIVSEEAWDPKVFIKLLVQNKIQWASLVPTQLHDVLELGEKPPQYLKALILGGGFVSEGLRKKAVLQGWPLLWSFGMTETAAMISLAKEPVIEPLEHSEIKIETDGYLSIKSASLFHGYIKADGTLDNPKINGWWTTGDQVKFENKKWILLGRGADYIKISGEGAYLQDLQSVLDEAGRDLKFPLTLYAQPDERRGQRIVLLIETKKNTINPSEVERVVSKFNANVLPVFKITSWAGISFLPRNEMGKINRQELSDMITTVTFVSVGGT